MVNLTCRNGMYVSPKLILHGMLRSKGDTFHRYTYLHNRHFKKYLNIYIFFHENIEKNSWKFTMKSQTEYKIHISIFGY